MYLALPSDLEEEVVQRQSWSQRFLKTRNSYLIIFAYLVVFTALNSMAITMPFWGPPPPDSPAPGTAKEINHVHAAKGGNNNNNNNLINFRSKEDAIVPVNHVAAVTNVNSTDAVEDLNTLDTVAGGNLAEMARGINFTDDVLDFHPLDAVAQVSDRAVTIKNVALQGTVTGTKPVDADFIGVKSVGATINNGSRSDVVGTGREEAAEATSVGPVTLPKKAAKKRDTTVRHTRASDDKYRYLARLALEPDELERGVTSFANSVTSLPPVTTMNPETSLPSMSPVRPVTQIKDYPTSPTHAQSFEEIWRYSLEYSCLAARILALLLLLCGSGVCTYNLWCNRLHLTPAPSRHALFGVSAGVVGIYGEVILWLGVKLISPNPILLSSQLFCSVTSPFCLGLGLVIYWDGRSWSRQLSRDSGTFWGGSSSSSRSKITSSRPSSGKDRGISPKRRGDSTAEGSRGATGRSSSGHATSSVSWSRERASNAGGGGDSGVAGWDAGGEAGLAERRVEAQPTVTHWRVESALQARRLQPGVGRRERVASRTAWLQREEEESTAGGVDKRVPGDGTGRCPLSSPPLLGAGARMLGLDAYTPWSQGEGAVSRIAGSRRWVSSTPQGQEDETASDRISRVGKLRDHSTLWFSAIDGDSGAGQAASASRHRKSTPGASRSNLDQRATSYLDQPCGKADNDDRHDDSDDDKNEADSEDEEKPLINDTPPLPHLQDVDSEPRHHQDVKSADHHSSATEGGSRTTTDNSGSAQGGREGGTDPEDFDHRTQFIDDDLYYHNGDGDELYNDVYVVHHVDYPDRRTPEVETQDSERDLLLKGEAEEKDPNSGKDCSGQNNTATMSDSLGSTTRLILSEKPLKLTFCESDEYLSLNEDDEDEAEEEEEELEGQAGMESKMKPETTWP